MEPRAGVRIARVALLSALAGGVYSLFAHGGVVPVGALTGAAMGAALAFLEMVVFDRWLGGRLERLPFAGYFALRVAAYLAVILGLNLLALAALGERATLTSIERRDLGFAVFACVTMNIVFSVNELLGPGVMFAVAAGRYRRPRRERRVLLYADLIGSTALAERLGEERFLDFLNAFYADIAAAIAAEGGEIHKYVGDEIIATWPAQADAGRPIRACFAAERRLAARSRAYVAKFGAAPAFRAALHEGPVVVGELGAMKKEIALIGDAMNTAARILEAARAADAPVLASATLYDRLAAPPPGLSARPLEPIALRGKAAPLRLVALARLPATGPSI